MTEPVHVASTRAVYDATAGVYTAAVGTEVNATFEAPIDRALLMAFVESLKAAPGRVADVGCGPGRVAAFLSAHGLDVVGVDVSPSMLAIARDAHPSIPFEDGQLTSLPFGDESLAGAVCWYSVIHTPPGELVGAFAEIERVLVRGGHVLLAFQAGDGGPVHRENAYGTGLTLTNYRHNPDEVATSLVDAGLHVHARAIREPELDHEMTPQAFIVARKGPGSAG